MHFVRLWLCTALCGCGERSLCAQGSLQDERGECVPSTCSAFSLEESGDEVIYVLEGASDGDGTRSRPFGSLLLAMYAVYSGGPSVIELGEGVYRENIQVRDVDLTLRGRCPELVRIEAEIVDEPVIDIDAPGRLVEISGLTLRGGEPAVFLHAGELLMYDGSVEDSSGAGVACEDSGSGEVPASLMLRQLVVQGNEYSPRFVSEHAYNAGVGVVGCTATLWDVRSMDNASAGLYAHRSQLDVSGGSFSHSRSIADELTEGGHGAIVSSSQLSMYGVQFVGNASIGLDLRGAGRAELRQITIREMREPSGATATYALKIQNSLGSSARADIENLRIEDSVGWGLVVVDSTITARHVRIAHLHESSQQPGFAPGLFLRGEGLQRPSSVEDLEISDVVQFGVAVNKGATLELNNARVEGVHRAKQFDDAVGLKLSSNGTLRATELDVGGVEGPGASVSFGAFFCATCSIHDNRFAGVVATNRALVELTDWTEVVGNVPGSQGGGFGIYGQLGDGTAHITLEDVTVGPHERAAVLLRGDGNEDPGSLSVNGAILWGDASVNPDLARPRGNALALAYTTSSAVVLRDTLLTGATTEALLSHHADARLEGAIWYDNVTNARWDLCMEGMEDPLIPNSEFCEGFDAPWEDLEWWFSVSLPKID